MKELLELITQLPVTDHVRFQVEECEAPRQGTFYACSIYRTEEPDDGCHDLAEVKVSVTADADDHEAQERLTLGMLRRWLHGCGKPQPLPPSPLRPYHYEDGIRPAQDAAGVPRCSGSGCPQYDGKRCGVVCTRVHPGTVCEPAVVQLRRAVEP